MPKAKTPVPSPTPVLEASPGCCQEASFNSREYYIPCNKPAVSVVQTKDPTPYRMCAMCADHNVRNRGATLVGSYEGPPPGVPAKPAPAPAGQPPVPAPNAAAAAFLVAQQAKMDEWYALTQELPAKIAREKQLRQELFDAAFVKPKLGTNRFALGYGKDLKATYKMSQTVDRAALQEHSPTIDDKLLERVLTYRPEVVVGAWNACTPEEKNILSVFVTEKPSLPSLEIVNLSKTSRR